MSANSFSFPPPPPPPRASYLEPPPGNTYTRGRGDRRWERGSRARGRGNSQRSLRGATHCHEQSSLHPAGPGFSDGNQLGGSYPLPNYPSVQQPQYSADPHNIYNSPHPSYVPVAPPSNPHQTNTYHLPNYQAVQPHPAPHPYNSLNYNAQAQQYPYQLPVEHPPHSSSRFASPPVTVGPPIRMGFGSQHGIGSRPMLQPHHGNFNQMKGRQLSGKRPPHQKNTYGHQSGRQRSPNRQRDGREPHDKGGNADYLGAFQGSTRRTQVAPAVPSFGNPLPLKPPAPEPETKKPKKKRKRRVNQLGLTPNADEHVSSSEEEEVDEELRLATTNGKAITGQQLEFTYKGQTSTLQSSDDIASWIEERKKRFPTAARKAENEERLRRLRDEQEEKMKQALKAAKLLERQKKTLEKDKQALEEEKQEAAAKAKLKVEKLRQKLKKEERRIAKAEAKSLKRSTSPDAREESASKAKRRRIKSDLVLDQIKKDVHVPTEVKLTAVGHVTEPSRANGTNGSFFDTSMISEKGEADPSNLIADPLTPTSQPAVLDHEGKAQPKPDTARSEKKDEENGVPDFPSSSDISVSSEDLSYDEDDDTSSGGSSSLSGTDSDAEGPENVSSRHRGPGKIPPPKRVSRQDKAICRDFLRSGRCRRGRRCRWRHALPDRAQKGGGEQEMPYRVQRKSLHQRLVEQELEKERQEKKKIEQHERELKNDTPTTAE
ncbi:MAG: hypothetical protein Q9182_005502 [Xanthomendoza sp. 2 TL-2023]